MYSPDKRHSVTYDARRIRAPPEKLPAPFDVAQQRVVSDDIVQRQRLSPFRHEKFESSPDSFEFQQPVSYSPYSSSSSDAARHVHSPYLGPGPTRGSPIVSHPESWRCQESASPKSGSSIPTCSSSQVSHPSLSSDKRVSSDPLTNRSNSIYSPREALETRSFIPQSNSFSFSEADDSVLQVSPQRETFADSSSNYSQLTYQQFPSSVPKDVASAPNGSESSSSPQKSVASSANSNAIKQIISSYDRSGSSLALVDSKSCDSRTTQGSSIPSFQIYHPERTYSNEAEAMPKSAPPKHNRNDSQSSSVSSASSSTLTSINNQQRFVRYVMSTQSSLSSKASSPWVMANVLSWLDYHGFPDSWKDCFKRNEISGNRFLELGNYDSTSTVWKQLSKTLGQDGNPSIVDKFISLLRTELQSAEANNNQTHLDIDNSNKQEHRKSSSTLWAQTSPAVPAKQRPFSYVEPGSSKNPKEHSHKFFRKHNRLASSDKDPASVPPLNSQWKYSSEALSGTTNSSGFKKSVIINTLRKYGGDKAVGIVKQVHSNPSLAKQTSNKKSGSTTNIPQKNHEDFSKYPSYVRPESQNFSVISQEDSCKSPISIQSVTTFPTDEAMELVKSTSSSSKNYLDFKYHPVCRKVSDSKSNKTVLLTQDNIRFVAMSVESSDLNNLETLKGKFMQKLDMINIGKITLHLTDFEADPGHALPDDLLYHTLQQDPIVKLKLTQVINSPDRIGTFSSTSSDSKSFDTTSDSNGNMYPATPQYLLQGGSSEKNIDYINFKDYSVNSRINQNEQNPSFIISTEKDHGATAMKLTMPQSRRVQQTNPGTRINDRGLPLLMTGKLSAPSVHNKETNHSESIKRSNSNYQANSSFSVVRREGREIDFDKRRMNSNESKAPRLIPNIYSSSVTDSAVSPISASTIHTFKDDSSNGLKPNDQTSRAPSTGSEIERTSNFVARRKAPPPPATANSVRKNSKRNNVNSENSPYSLPSVEDSASTDSIDSFRSSQVSSKFKDLGARAKFTVKRFDFSDAPNFEVISQARSNGNDSQDDFFSKPVDKTQNQKPLGGTDKTASGADDEDSDEDFFVKPMKKENFSGPQTGQMKIRPSVEEVYDNLERYFPNTILDKPVIDDSPESPMVVSTPPETQKPASRNRSISRTFSSANISPVNPTNNSKDEFFYGDGTRLRRRMKTIRIVASEAHKKRLASQRAAGASTVGRPTKKQVSDRDPTALTRTNTKLWGQKVVELTPDGSEKGFVSRIKNVANDSYEEIAWVKGELIGRGSFGSVYLALNVTTGEMLAVKQVVVDANRNSEGLDALHKEVETMKDLDHLNIVQYLGFEQSNQTYNLFLEYVAGGSISSCLKTYGKFEESLVKFVTRQILEGLKFLHENGILHRDLKADNLLLETDGICKISDFGISKRSKDIYSNNAEMSMQGTVFWMAPEVIHSIVEEKKQGYSAKVDIWSLGCVMLEMFAGKRPWSNEAVISAIYKIGKTKLAPPIPEGVSPEAKDFLNKCFTIDSEKRPTAAELLNHEFVQVDKHFQFSQTKLSQIIKMNSRKSVARPH